MKNTQKVLNQEEMKSVQGGGLFGVLVTILTGCGDKKTTEEEPATGSQLGGTKSMGATEYCEQSDQTWAACPTSDCTMTDEEIANL